MRDLFKTYAPLVALAIGFGGYYLYGLVKSYNAQTELLGQFFANQCTTILENRGMTVTELAEEPEPVEPEEEEE